MKKAEEKQAAIYKKAFSIIERLLDPKGERRVWISCIHQMRRVKGLNEWLHAFLMNSAHSGFYPFKETGLTQLATNFDVDFSEDRTNDYILTSLLNPSHFGWFHINWSFAHVCLIPIFFFIDPYNLHKWAYHLADTWLWQFGYSPNAENPLCRVYFKALTLKSKKPAERVKPPTLVSKRAEEALV